MAAQLFTSSSSSSSSSSSGAYGGTDAPVELRHLRGSSPEAPTDDHPHLREDDAVDHGTHCPAAATHADGDGGGDGGTHGSRSRRLLQFVGVRTLRMLVSAKDRLLLNHVVRPNAPMWDVFKVPPLG